MSNCWSDILYTTILCVCEQRRLWRVYSFEDSREPLLLNNLISTKNLCAGLKHTCEPRHEISNNVLCATSKGSDQPAHMRSLIRAFASRLNIL